jgi:DNA modification methylase
MKLKDIKPNPNNPRVLRDDKFQKLKQSITEFPKMLALRPMVIDENNVVLGGNMRLRALQELGFTDVEEAWVKRSSDLTEDEKKRFIIADNVAFGEWDWDTLANDWEVVDLEAWGLDIPQFDTVEELEASEDDYEVPEGGIETDIVIGDLFEIGEHRLLCGNCIHVDSISKLMNGKFADTIITDPPYSSGGFQESGKTTESIGTRSGESIALDNLSTTGYKALIREFIPLHPKVDSVYIFTDWKMWQHTLESVEMTGFRVRNMIVWDKMQMGMGMPWRNQHELICYGKRTAGKINSGKYGNVLQSKRTGNEFHPTQKPVDIIDPLIKNTDCKIIFEPFAGSGTTMIAAHQNNKICYATELSPNFCAVIIDRMKKLDSTLIIKRNGVEIKTT